MNAKATSLSLVLIISSLPATPSEIASDFAFNWALYPFEPQVKKSLLLGVVSTTSALVNVITQLQCNHSICLNVITQAHLINCKNLRLTFPSYFAVHSVYGPMGRDVETLITFMRTMMVPYMWELDPAIVPIPFREEVRVQ